MTPPERPEVAGVKMPRAMGWYRGDAGLVYGYVLGPEEVAEIIHKARAAEPLRGALPSRSALEAVLFEWGAANTSQGEWARDLFRAALEATAPSPPPKELAEHLRNLHHEIGNYERRASVQDTYGDYGCQTCDRLLAPSTPEPLTRENATAREQLAHQRGFTHTAIDGSHIPEIGHE